MWETFWNYFADTGFAQLTAGNLVMIGIGLLFIYLAVRKKFEPLLLVPIGFGILIGNVPYDTGQLSLGVYDGPVSESRIGYLTTTTDVAGELTAVQPLPADQRHRGAALVHEGKAIMVNNQALFAAPSGIPSRWQKYIAARERIEADPPAEPGAETLPQPPEPMVAELGQGREVLLSAATYYPGGKFPQVWSPEKQDPWNASVFWWLFAGVGLAGFYPPLIFLGVGVLTDFGPLLGNPRVILLGAAAQGGIFFALLGAIVLGFDMNEASAIGIIGGADGPTAIFTATILAPHLLGAVALAAYSYMAMVPIIQPPIMRLLTTRAERLIRMPPPPEVAQKVRICFPIVAFLLTAFIAPGALPLLGMLFFGNLLRESLVTERLAKTASTAFIDIVTILLGVTVGAKTQASSFLTMQTIGVFILGILAFAVATAIGVLFAKGMNHFSKHPINPLIGAAGVSAVPMAARVVHTVGQEEDPQNYLLMHAMGPNVAGVIGSAVAAGVLLSYAAAAGG